MDDRLPDRIWVDPEGNWWPAEDYHEEGGIYVHSSVVGSLKAKRVRCAMTPNYYPDGRPLFSARPRHRISGEQGNTVIGWFIPDEVQ